MRNPTERFSDRVADYVKYRPSYPWDVIEHIAQFLDWSPQPVIGDIGCGPGIFSHLLLERGACVTGIEPNGEMLKAAQDWLGSNPRFQSMQVPAESTDLPDQYLDAITVAQAFHWFDPAGAKKEFRRILKPDRWIFLVWNERVATGSSFAEGYEKALRDFVPEYAETGHRNRGDDQILSWFERDRELEQFSNAQNLNQDQFLGRVYSSSYIPAHGTQDREMITDVLIALFNENANDGCVAFDYVTKVYRGRLIPE